METGAQPDLLTLPWLSVKSFEIPESPEVGLLNHIFYILMFRLARARQHLSTLLAEKRQLDQL
jgi:hypothetical protein